MVAGGAESAQRAADSTGARNRVPALRFVAVRLGGRTKRSPRITWLLVRYRQGGPYHVQGTKGGTSRDPYVPTLPGGPPGITARGQPGRGIRTHPLDVPEPRHDGGAPKTVVDFRLPRDHSCAAIYPIGSKHLGRSAFQGGRPQRLAATPSGDVSLPGQPVGPTLRGPFCLHGKHTATPLQFEMARPLLRGRGLPAPPGRRMDRGAQLVQPTLGAPAGPGRLAATFGSGSDRGGPPMGGQGMVSSPARGSRRLRGISPVPRPVLPRLAGLARGGRAGRLERHSHAPAVPAWRHLRAAAAATQPSAGITVRRGGPATHLAITDPPASHQPSRRYQLQPARVHPAWQASMKAALSSMLGEDSLGQQALSLVAGSLAATTVGTYGSAFQRFLSFCSQVGLDPLDTCEADVVRYLAWLGQEGTVAAASLQPYLSAINRFLGDHGQEPVALGPLVARARQGLKLQQRDSTPAPVRVPLPAETVGGGGHPGAPVDTATPVTPSPGGTAGANPEGPTGSRSGVHVPGQRLHLNCPEGRGGVGRLYTYHRSAHEAEGQGRGA